MNYIRLVIVSLALLIFPVAMFAQQNANAGDKPADKKEEKKDAAVAKKDEDLARVVILPFSDRTKSKNFAYMSESLSEAISTSMYKNFTYTKIDQNEVKRAVYEADQYVKKSKIEKKTRTPAAGQNDKGKAKTEEELQQDEDQLNISKRIAKNLKSDIVIYGYYKYDNTTNELVFAPVIYIASTGNSKELEDTKNVVDVTIFKATEKVAKSLVDNITAMIEEAEKASGEKKAVAEAEKKPGEKKALTKKVGQAPVLDWAAKKIAISFMVGNSLAPVGKMDNLKPNEYTTNNQYINVRFWPVRSIHLALRFGHVELESNNTTGKNRLNMVDLMMFGGYGLYTEKRMYSYAELGAGYFVGDLKVTKFNTSGGGQYDRTYKIQNPVFGARIGTDLLLTSFLSMGVSSMLQVFYDKPNPVYHVNLMFNLGVVF